MGSNTVAFDHIRAPPASIALAARVPLLPGAVEVVFVDLDSTHRQV